MLAPVQDTCLALPQQSWAVIPTIMVSSAYRMFLIVARLHVLAPILTRFVCLVVLLFIIRRVGVDIYQDVVDHSRAAMERWRNAVGRPVPHIEWIHGNALNICLDKGEAVVGFDRIYVGASVSKEDLPKLAFLLRPGGILVGPVDDELMKVVRIGSRLSPRKNSVASMMETDDPNPLPPTEFTQQVLSGVRFAALLQHPNIDTILPSTVWNPSIHHQYPDSFRNSCREILLCSNAAKEQNPPPVKRIENVNVAGLLPRVLWMDILSYTHRDCKYFTSCLLAASSGVIVTVFFAQSNCAACSLL